MTEEACKNAIIRLVEPLAHALGLVLWGVEVVRAGRVLVRVYVDVPVAACGVAGHPADGRCGLSVENPAANPAASPAASPATDAVPPPLSALSATVDQCEKISRQLGLALDVEDCFADPYVLEVSTPGLTRVFFCLEQMSPYVGDVVEARLERPLAPQSADAAPSELPARRVWRGILRAVEDTGFVLAPAQVSPEGDVLHEDLPAARIPWEAARRVSRMYVFRKPVKPGKGPGQGRGKGIGKKPSKKSEKEKGDEGGRGNAEAGRAPGATPEEAAATTAGRIPG